MSVITGSKLKTSKDYDRNLDGMYTKEQLPEMIAFWKRNMEKATDAEDALHSKMLMEAGERILAK